MKRNKSRVRAMIIMYNYDLTRELDFNGITKIIQQESEDYQIDLEFSNQLVMGTIENITAIDELISLNLEKYRIERLSYVDRNIIRLAVYEMVYLKQPIEIVINEYLNITHEFSRIPNFDSVKFNNAVLDKIAKKLRERDEPR